MVQFGALRDLARRELTECLDRYSGKKIIVWDEELAGPLDLIAKYQFFKDRQVVKSYPLKAGRLPYSGGQVENIVFITRPDVSNMDKISDNVKGEEIAASGSGTEVNFHILFIPNCSLLCEIRLKDRGVYGSFTYINELQLFWFPLDTDVISMEKRSIFRDYHLNKDPTCLHSVAKGMMALQAVFGFIPRIYGKGRSAKQLCEYMMSMRREMQAAELELSVPPQFDTLIILDRQVDLISPLITQLTYEGLIDECFEINNTCIKLPSDKFANQAQDSTDGSETKSTKTIPLNSNDEIYADLRDKNFNAVGPTLSKKAKAISAQFEERHGARTVRDLKLFVDKMPQMQVIRQSLATHTSIAELIKEQTDCTQFLEFLQTEQELVNNQNVYKPLDFVEDAACQDAELIRIFRVMCLQSIIGSGLRPKVLDSYRKMIMHAYGHRHLLSLINLEKAGLLTSQGAGNSGNSTNYAVLRRRLNLTQDDVNEQNPTDITYVHSVYAPLSIRLVQQCASPGWRNIRDVLDLISGPSFEEVQRFHTSNLRNEEREINIDGQDAASGTKKTLVLFVGGCTYAEISALRFLSQLEESSTEYLVATTSMINGNNFISGLTAELNDALSPF